MINKSLAIVQQLYITQDNKTETNC